MRLVFDIEADGLLDTLTKIHCIVIHDLDSKELFSFGPDKIDEAITMLEKADVVIGHNVIGYDIPAIKKVYPTFSIPPYVDTLICSRLIWSDIKENDFRFQRKSPDFPSRLIGKHSLESWGYRLRLLKGDYALSNDFSTWSPAMQEYCERDVAVTVKLFERIDEKKYSLEAIELEHKFAQIIANQEQIGFPFDEKKAQDLYARLVKKRLSIEESLQDKFKPIEHKTIFIPKVNNKTRGYVKGQATEKINIVAFNPNSRQHVAERLINKYGWKPKEFTPDGKPKVDDSILAELNYPEAKELSEYFLIQKRIAQLAEGNQGWLKVQKHGRVFHSVITNGTPSGRCRHHSVNISQVPSSSVPYGVECRSLFHAPTGYKLVGCDASGIELRCLGHYLQPFDSGAFIKELLSGDIHEANRTSLGLSDRSGAKRFIYCLIYGGGNARLGETIQKGAEEGKRLKAKFFKANPAFKRLREAVIEKAQSGFLKGLDGRLLPIRSTHSALNTLLQSAGSLIMKQATILLHEELDKTLTYAEDYAMVAHIHDEVQLLVKEQHAEEVGNKAVQSIRHTAEHFKFRCQLDGEYKIGNNWSETH
tara:strand:- start:337 stop:2106 length:1770 start_codon:yes stop_codon:yes gene_type:complete